MDDVEEEFRKEDTVPTTLVCITLVTDEMIIGETNGISDESGFIIVYSPFRVVLHKNGQWMIFPLNPLRMNGGPFSLRMETIKYISMVDKQHVMAYATMLFSTQVTRAKDVLTASLKTGIISKRTIDEVFIGVAEFAVLITERYGLEIPLDSLRSQFYEFVLENIEVITEVRQ